MVASGDQVLSAGRPIAAPGLLTTYAEWVKAMGDHPSTTLFLQLSDLTVSRPTLEDVYLHLTKET